MTPHEGGYPRFELVSGSGDAGNAFFRIAGERLFVTDALEPGLHPIRVRVTDSAGNFLEQELGVWVGSGHADSNGDGVPDRVAVKLGLQPDGPPAPGAWLGNVPVTMPEGSPPSEFLLRADVIPGELYWVESSTDLADWELFPGSLFVPADFTRVPVSWDIPASPDLRRFWRIGGGWPAGRGSDPLAGGLAGLHFVGGNSTGWHYDAATGVLSQNSADPNPSEWVHFGDNLSDFLLRLDYRVSGGANAGVFLRAAALGNPWETGCEIQITNEPRLPIHSTGAVYDRIPAHPPADASPDVWHRMEVLMKADWLRVAVDGVVTVDVPDVKARYPQFSWASSGLIGLQDSHGLPGTIEYRNIRVLPLAE